MTISPRWTTTTSAAAGPTVHKAFDEATAILAGDALLTIAFDILAGLDAPAETRVALIAGLARAAGVGGMAGGQMLDLDRGCGLGRGRAPRACSG